MSIQTLVLVTCENQVVPLYYHKREGLPEYLKAVYNTKIETIENGIDTDYLFAMDHLECFLIHAGYSF